LRTRGRGKGGLPVAWIRGQNSLLSLSQPKGSHSWRRGQGRSRRQGYGGVFQRDDKSRNWRWEVMDRKVLCGGTRNRSVVCHGLCRVRFLGGFLFEQEEGQERTADE
jgi:hypothetical protein